ncbi:MAG: hypothetical protein K2M27_08630 [Muribaculaceae bacterium]|nr:hypothetical protein [Muribaculaceae bacterium]MDE6533581.1 hypothetical protein [Muribaculaceae bacterium]
MVVMLMHLPGLSFTEFLIQLNEKMINDINTDEFIRNWLASIKNLTEFTCFTWFDTVWEPPHIQELTDDFPIFKDYRDIDIWITNETGEILTVSIQSGGISSPRVSLYRKNGYILEGYEADIAICRHIQKLLYRFPMQTIRQYHYQYRYES